MECKKCGTDLESQYYKYRDEIYCLDCLLEIIGFGSYTETHYTKDGEYVASDGDIVDVLQEDYKVEEINNDGQWYKDMIKELIE